MLVVNILQDPNCLISLGKGCARSQGESARVRYAVMFALAALIYLFTYVHSSIADVYLLAAGDCTVNARPDLDYGTATVIWTWKSGPWAG